MAFHFRNLSPATRELMIDEIQMDIDAEKLYDSPRLSASGRSAYPGWLGTAAREGSEATLADALGRPGVFNEYEDRKTKNGVIQARVPVTASETLAEGEFNRFYIRALCRMALERGQQHVTVYRAKEVQNARSESAAKIGAQVPAEALLADLRENVGVDTALGLPPGPNSGLSVEL